MDNQTKSDNFFKSVLKSDISFCKYSYSSYYDASSNYPCHYNRSEYCHEEEICKCGRIDDFS